MISRSGPDTIVEALDLASLGKGQLRFHDMRGNINGCLSYRELRQVATTFARCLRARGFCRGDRLAVIAETRPEFLIVFYGCQYAGVVPCPLPYRSMTGSPAVYAETLAAMLKAGGAGTLLALPQQTGLEEAAAKAGADLLAYDAILAGPEEELPPPVSGQDCAYIQFSSGSTANPKGIIISQRAVSAHAAAILTDGLHLTPDDRAFSWLPFYHDMGLVGFSIAALYGQCSVDYLPPQAFARRPVLWLRLMAQYGSTITYAPGFGYRLAAQRYASEPEPIDLSRLRVAGIGGDMIRPDVLELFATAMHITGFKKQALLPSYGLAEATLAVSFSAIGHPFEVDTIEIAAADCTGKVRFVDLDTLQQREGRQFVSCGRPLPGIDVKIVSCDGVPLPDKTIGHILVKSPALMSGYASAATDMPDHVDAEGFIDTGDLGYMRNGQLVVTGRSKDLILFRGRNIWPEDIEWMAERVACLSHGHATAFSIDDRSSEDRVILLIEARGRQKDEHDTLRQRLHQEISSTIGLSCVIVFVNPGSLPKTSSGKLARSHARERYLQGAYDEGGAMPDTAGSVQPPV